MNTTFTAIILAGGKSRRFGRDKTLLEINGSRVMDIIVEKCRPLFSEILIAGGERLDFDIPGVPALRDTYPGIGPLGGIHAGLREATSEVCFVTACDMPNFQVPLIKRLLEASDDCDAVVLKTGERTHPLFAVYKKSILPTVERMISQNIYSVLRLLDEIRVGYIQLPTKGENPTSAPIFNINYKEDYEAFVNSGPPVLCVVGFSGSGKTTYLEKLIPALKIRGLRLGVIKHDAHSFEVDIPGKDSWRLTQAGADITVIASPDKIAIMEKWDREEDLSRVAGRLRGKVDLILTEGYKRGSALKIEIRRAAAKGREASCGEGELFALACDHATEGKVSAPVLPLDDAEPMADLIVKFLEEGALCFR